MTNRVVEKFNTFYSSKEVYTVFVLIVSSLYKEILENKISRKKAIKTIDYIEKTFGNRLTNYPKVDPPNLFHHHFKNAITAYQHKAESQLNIPEPLLDILNDPKNLRNKINSLFAEKNFH